MSPKKDLEMGDRSVYKSQVRSKCESQRKALQHMVQHMVQHRLTGTRRTGTSSAGREERVTSERSPLFDAIRIVVPSPLGCSSTHTAITLQLSSEMADRNAGLLAISFSLTTLNNVLSLYLGVKRSLSEAQGLHSNPVGS
jgi:hypothetical protein